jgi:hypothetical protein
MTSACSLDRGTNHDRATPISRLKTSPITRNLYAIRFAFAISPRNPIFGRDTHYGGMQVPDAERPEPLTQFVMRKSASP